MRRSTPIIYPSLLFADSPWSDCSLNAKATLACCSSASYLIDRMTHYYAHHLMWVFVKILNHFSNDCHLLELHTEGFGWSNLFTAHLSIEVFQEKMVWVHHTHPTDNNVSMQHVPLSRLQSLMAMTLWSHAHHTCKTRKRKRQSLHAWTEFLWSETIRSWNTLDTTSVTI